MNETQTGAQHVTQLKRYVGIAITQRLVETSQVAQRQPIDEQWNDCRLHSRWYTHNVLRDEKKGRWESPPLHLSHSCASPHGL